MQSMKNRAGFILGSAVALGLTVMASGAWGAERAVSPPALVPVLASGLGNTGVTADDWVVTAFYYSPESIVALAPANGDTDLSVAPFLAPPVLGGTPYVQGFYVGKAGAMVPIVVKYQNAPGTLVPVWFTPADKFDDLNWTINAMTAAGSLVGWADSYTEVFTPWDPANPEGPWKATAVASGVMEDGRTFRVESSGNQAFYNNMAFPCRVRFGR